MLFKTLEAINNSKSSKGLNVNKKRNNKNTAHEHTPSFSLKLL